MWLINTTTLDLENFTFCPIGTYAILSHTWGPSADELNFKEFKTGQGRHKVGFQKVQQCCEKARQEGLPYAWIDTCCIDKNSSAELSEAINSMFSWYRGAKICYAFLEDITIDGPVSSSEDRQTFAGSRWFTRGWTLQELIAPVEVDFYTRNWTFIGNRTELVDTLHERTRIHRDVLLTQRHFLDCSIAQRMSWAADRQTTRIEDIAYCLIGLFEANIPLLYGEGSKAFLRLQREIMRHTDDETIFSWTDVPGNGSGLLAPSPANFRSAGNVEPNRTYRERSQYSEAPRGFAIEFQLLPCEMNTYTVPLRCSLLADNGSPSQVAIYLCRTTEDQLSRRVRYHDKSLGKIDDAAMAKSVTAKIYIPDDGRNLELAPRGGFPTIDVKSNMRILHIANSVADSIGNIAQNSSTDQIADPEIGTGRHELLASATRESTQNLNCSGQLRFADDNQMLEKGACIALARTSVASQGANYILHIGFDIWFRPICILLAGPIAGCNYKVLNMYLHDSFWSITDSEIKLCKLQETLERALPSWLGQLIISPFLKPLIARYQFIGNRCSGLRLSINRCDLPSIGYRHKTFAVNFTNLENLKWQLTVTEEDSHHRDLLPGISHYERPGTVWRRWGRQSFCATIWKLIASILTIFFYYLTCSTLMDHLDFLKGSNSTNALAALVIVLPTLLNLVILHIWRGKLDRRAIYLYILSYLIIIVAAATYKPAQIVKQSTVGLTKDALIDELCHKELWTLFEMCRWQT